MITVNRPSLGSAATVPSIIFPFFSAHKRSGAMGKLEPNSKGLSRDLLSLPSDLWEQGHLQRFIF